MGDKEGNKEGDKESDLVGQVKEMAIRATEIVSKQPHGEGTMTERKLEYRVLVHALRRWQ